MEVALTHATCGWNKRNNVCVCVCMYVCVSLRSRIKRRCIQKKCWFSSGGWGKKWRRSIRRIREFHNLPSPGQSWGAGASSVSPSWPNSVCVHRDGVAGPADVRLLLPTSFLSLMMSWLPSNEAPGEILSWAFVFTCRPQSRFQPHGEVQTVRRVWRRTRSAAGMTCGQEVKKPMGCFFQSCFQRISLKLLFEMCVCAWMLILTLSASNGL